MSESDSGSSGSGGCLDRETADLLKRLPPKANIGRSLDEFIPTLPIEVEEAVKSQGANVTGARHLKTSFHKTFLVELSPPLTHSEKSHSLVIVQVLGVELGDKAVFGNLQVATLVRAHELARLAGVCVPAIFATGVCNTALGSLDFIVEEYVVTETVEDKVCAPSAEWGRIRREVVDKLKSFSLAGVDTSPLPRYDSCQFYIKQLMQLVPVWDEVLVKALECLCEKAVETEEASVPVLLHQDINDGNLLCSKASERDSWKLDALIDWESAAVVDSKCYDNDDLWATAETFATVVKGAHLAERLAQDTLPRCELEELIENYQGAAQRLDKAGLLPFETWASKVSRSRESLSNR